MVVTVGISSLFHPGKADSHVVKSGLLFECEVLKKPRVLELRCEKSLVSMEKLSVHLGRFCDVGTRLWAPGGGGSRVVFL